MNLFALHYSDDNKQNTFNNGGNNGHRLKNVTCKQTYIICVDTQYICRVMALAKTFQLTIFSDSYLDILLTDKTTPMFSLMKDMMLVLKSVSRTKA